ncbi:Asd/ArgC dimerization domain-containing protein [Staphylococcus saprophyticus]|uniref:Asd/ArgC dimerization domain-containing protein n=1 Tax=Staphylococcus saprophyticus TaxID=29385 RepID=UPI0021B26E0A|nr:Asd/ArgC dimerization domain-containing protein [Staphylococcus saprophyticus]
MLGDIDTFLEDGYRKEEEKMIDETGKILEDDDLKVRGSWVGVGVEESDSVEMSVRLEKEGRV